MWIGVKRPMKGIVMRWDHQGECPALLKMRQNIQSMMTTTARY